MSGPVTSTLGNWWAPALCAAVLVASWAFGLTGVQSSADAGPFHETVRESVESIPYKIGPWVGSDVEAAAAATQLLKPVKLMQRRYTDPATGRGFSLLLVYCGDSRDMLGHYPPNCYPAHGWRMESSDEDSFTLAGGRFPATRYEFERTAAGLDQHMGVFNFFMLPAGDARLVADYEALNRSAKTRSGVSLGAGQVQILFSESVRPEERREIIDRVLGAIEPTLETITLGAESHG